MHFLPWDIFNIQIILKGMPKAKQTLRTNHFTKHKRWVESQNISFFFYFSPKSTLGSRPPQDYSRFFYFGFDAISCLLFTLSNLSKVFVVFQWCVYALSVSRELGISSISKDVPQIHCAVATAVITFFFELRRFVFGISN